MKINILLPFRKESVLIKLDVLTKQKSRNRLETGDRVSKVATRETPLYVSLGLGGAKLDNYVIIRDVTSDIETAKGPGEM